MAIGWPFANLVDSLGKYQLFPKNYPHIGYTTATFKAVSIQGGFEPKILTSEPILT